jgi:regulatory protein
MGKITSLTSQQHDQQRVNVFLDGTYSFSLDLYQVSELGIRVGKEYTEAELDTLKDESVFGKLYARALEYTMIRPHSVKEVRDYLWKKTRETRYRSRSTGEIKVREGVSQAVADRVLERLRAKGYADDVAFTRYWVENRNQRKGTSLRRLQAELFTKGVASEVIEDAMQNSSRDEASEIRKIIQKKASKYDDRQKLVAYLAHQGFSYDTIQAALSESEEAES